MRAFLLGRWRNIRLSVRFACAMNSIHLSPESTITFCAQHRQKIGAQRLTACPRLFIPAAFTAAFSHLHVRATLPDLLADAGRLGLD